MYLTGFADEAGRDIDTQIRATKELGWNAIESRNINGKNIHDIDEQLFDEVCTKLAAAGVSINCFGSAIANWAKKIDDDFSLTVTEVERAIPRMQRLGTKLIRIMSYQRCADVNGKGEQKAAERFRRLRDITARFLAAGIQPVHENCMNYGGMSWRHTLELIEQVPGLKLIYDTGNSPFMKDYAQSGDVWQNGWEFYQAVKQHVIYVHIKDSISPAVDGKNGGKERYTFPGEGQGYVREILRDLQTRGYDGGISIEPHLASVFHDPAAVGTSADRSYELYVAYGQRLMALLAELGWTPHLFTHEMK
jgi:sugar phosphate isomerase/epimerase